LRVLSLFARQQGDYRVSGAILAEAMELYQSIGDTAGLARVLRDEGWQAYSEHEGVRAIAAFEQSLALYRSLSDWSAVADVLLCLAHIMHTAEPNLDRMQTLLDESLEIYRTLDDPIGIAGALRHYANGDILRGNYSQARERFAEALDLYRQHRLLREAAWTLEMAGEAAWLLGDLATASDEWEQALAFFQANGAKEGVMLCYHHLGQVARRTARLELAEHRYRQSLALAWEMLNSKMVARCLAGLGAVALASGRPVRAARLLGAAAAELFQQPSFLPPADLADYQSLCKNIESALGSAEYQAAWQEGSAMSDAQAVEFALARS
jgi:tetratricopeptide (TPR) repeat protein